MDQQIESNRMQEAVERLGGRLPDASRVLCLLIEAHGRPSRNYHDNRHRLAMSAPSRGDLRTRLGDPDRHARADAEILLAGSFHDVVYHVDEDLPDTIRTILAPSIEFGGGNNGLDMLNGRPAFPDQDRIAHLALNLFDLEPGQTLETGRNEFLSALTAGRILAGCDIPPGSIARIMADIEATIPFRDQSKFRARIDRLVQANERLELGLSEEKIAESDMISTAFANRDVDGFASPHLRDFVRGTLRLIPENRPELRDPNFRTAEYQSGLAGSISFHDRFLDEGSPDLAIENIFHRNAAGDYPSEAEIREKIEMARRNIENARLFLQSRYVTATVLQAMAIRIGEPEVPFRRFARGERLTLDPVGSLAPIEGPDSTLLEALEGSGSEEVRSPISRFLYRKIGGREIARLHDRVRGIGPGDTTNAPKILRWLLAEIGEENFDQIAGSLADLARSLDRPDRAAALESIRSNL